MTVLDMCTYHARHGHTDEMRAAARDLAAEVQGDTYPADLVWAASDTRLLTADELTVIYPTWGEPRPMFADDDIPTMGMAAALVTVSGVVTSLLVAAFVVSRFMIWMGVW